MHDCPIGFADHLESLFRCLVAAVGVGMVFLHQLLIPFLDDGNRYGRSQVESHQGFLFGRCRTLFRCGFSRFEETEIIPEGPSSFRKIPWILTQTPCWSLPNSIAAYVSLDLFFAHPRVVIPGRIVLPHMLQAEPNIGIQRGSGFRRPVFTVPFATRPLAQSRLVSLRLERGPLATSSNSHGHTMSVRTERGNPDYRAPGIAGTNCLPSLLDGRFLGDHDYAP